MKKFTLITIIGLLIGYISTAQSTLQLSNYSQTVYSNDSSQTLSTYLTVENHGSATEYVMLDRTVITLAPNMEEGFCFGPKCYPPGTNSCTVPDTIAAGGVSNTFVADVSPYGFWGSNTIHYHFYNQNSISDSVGITLNFVFSNTTGIAENKTEYGVSHPLRNPADAFTVFSYNLQNNEVGDKMVLYNMLGTLVKTLDIPGRNGTLVMNTSELKSGVYFASYVSGNKIKETYKLVVSHH